jgi:hypothetical protein
VYRTSLRLVGIKAIACEFKRCRIKKKIEVPRQRKKTKQNSAARKRVQQLQSATKRELREKKEIVLPRRALQ